MINMVENEVIQNFTQDLITDLVLTALEQRRLSGLSELLRLITKATNAYGCILWQVVPGLDLQADPSNGLLFVLDQWMPGTHPLLMHNLPVTESIVGEAAHTGRTINVKDVPNDDRVFKTNSWVPNAGIQSMCATPIKLRGKSSDNVIGVLSLYRNLPQPFEESELLQSEQLARLIPSLYSAIRDRVSQDLIRQINDLLHQADLQAGTVSSSTNEMKLVFQQVCNTVADTFQCLEVSIFLEDPLEDKPTYRLTATTWPDFIHLWKSTYQPTEQD
ncbi:MAG TPA: GAF domain-containing protein, partial [Blastocatellia bacterium]|nr:GAF domain-containing protein [Blastocatellia bacterium]